MDVNTQALLERARQRRQMLEKKMGDTPVQRKRPVPLRESQQENTQIAPVIDDDLHSVLQTFKLLRANGDSPNKRQCTREEEELIKPDTPAIPSIRSRRNQLNERHIDDEDEMDYEPVGRSHVGLTELPAGPSRPASTGCRSRLAALAQSINSWEDDLTHHDIKPKEKPKKVWQPPSTNEDLAPSKPPRTFDSEASPSNKPARNFTSESTLPSKPPRTFTASPVKVDIQSKVKSPNRFQPVSNSSPAPFYGSSGIREKKASPVKSSPIQVTRSSPIRVATDRAESSMKSQPASVTKVEKTQDKPPSGLPAHVTKLKPPRMSLEQYAKLHRRKSMSPDEPTKKPVHSRMAAWEERVQKEKEMTPSYVSKHTVSPVAKAMTPASKTARPVSASTLPRHQASPIKGSPSKLTPNKSASNMSVGDATKSIHDRLNAMHESWKNNEIAESIRKQKETDMAVLQNRWKDGLVKESSVDKEAEERAEKISKIVQSSPKVAPTIPVPPPPPVSNSTVSTDVKKTSKTTRRDEHRDKIRSEARYAAGYRRENFENKLTAMGFDIKSTTDLGHVATLDLTPHKKKKSPEKKPSQAKVIVEEKMVTTMKLGDAKTTLSETHRVVPADQMPLSAIQAMQKADDKKQIATYSTALKVPTTPSNGTSIYSLIKKTPQSATSADINSRAKPAPAASETEDDSFEESIEDTEAEEEEEEEFKRPTHPVSRPLATRRLPSESSMTSESSVYSETQTDYTEDEYTENSYTGTEDSYDDEESNASGVDELLDEVMDNTIADSEYERPQPAPRTSKQVTSPRRSPTRNYNSNRTPQHQRTAVTFDSELGSTTATDDTASSGTASSYDSEPETKTIVYSMDLYRSKDRQNPAPKMTIVRHEQNGSRFKEPDEELPYIPEKSTKEKLQELQEMVNQEQTIIMQTSNALNQCCGADSAFANSAEAVECHRLLLISSKKREGYLEEMHRLRSGKVMHGQPMGSLTISNISLPINKDFMNRIGSINDTHIHYFICLLRNKAHTIFTQMVSTHDALVRGALELPNMIKLNDVPQDFRYNLEVYGMSISRETNPVMHQGKTPKKKSEKTPKKTPKKKTFLSGLLGSNHPSSMQSPGGPNAVRTTNFVLVGNLPITMRSLNKSHFTLERVPYTSPLQGTVHIKLTCVMENPIEEAGFLTMFEDVSGFGAWHRRWCVLRHNKISFWKYPDDEKIKDPIGYIDLKQCISESIGLIPRDICARPNTFELVTIRRQTRKDADTLTTRCSNTVTTTRHQLSADTKDDRLLWCDRLNEALKNLRMWHADALKPIKLIAGNPYENTV